MGTDPAWLEHVGPLLDLLVSVGLSPEAWLRDPEVARLQARLSSNNAWTDTKAASIHHAIGYLEATSNLTQLSWAEQFRHNAEDWFRE